MAKTLKGKKIVAVKPYIKHVGKKVIRVRRYRRSVPEVSL